MRKMIDSTCSYYDGDEDCHKCVKYGYIFGCPSDCTERRDYGEIDIGDYPDTIPNQFDNMTGSMNL